MISVPNCGSIAEFLFKLSSDLINKIYKGFSGFHKLNILLKKSWIFGVFLEKILEIDKFDLILKSWPSLYRCRQQLARNSVEFVSAYL